MPSSSIHTDNAKHGILGLSPKSLVIIVGTVIVVGAGVGIGIGLSSSSPSFAVSHSSVPGSKYHTSNCGSVASCGNVATWWGYNMAKLVRGTNGTLYSGYFDNSVAYPTVNHFVMLRKAPDGEWEEGHRLPASRPGNVLIDESGNVHALVFEATDVSVSDSWGKLKHYWFASGDISTSSTLVTPETVIDNDGTSETVNIRVGAALRGSTLLFAFGLSTGLVQAEHLYACTLLASGACTGGAAGWTAHVATGDGTSTLGHDLYYPHAVVRASGALAALPVQDDYENPPSAPAYNVFQFVAYFEAMDASTWAANNLILGDLRTNALASSRYDLIEATELFEDSSGRMHVIWREKLDPDNQYASSAVVHAMEDSAGGATFTPSTLNFADDTVESSLNWVRLAEATSSTAASSSLYYVACSYDKLYVGRVGANLAEPITLTDITPNGVSLQGPYLYTARTASGRAVVETAAADGSGLDVLLLAGASAAYPDAPNYAVRIPAELFDALP